MQLHEIINAVAYKQKGNLYEIIFFRGSNFIAIF